MVTTTMESTCGLTYSTARQLGLLSAISVHMSFRAHSTLDQCAVCNIGCV